jgi:anti-sigma factor RsiW
MRHIPEDELHAYLDQGLSRTQCVEIESHLADCPSCPATRDGIAALRDRTTALLARLAPARSVPPGFHTLRERADAVASKRRRRLHVAAWAASLVAAVGLGWMASSIVRTSRPAGAAGPTVASGPAPLVATPATPVRNPVESVSAVRETPPAARDSAGMRPRRAALKPVQVSGPSRDSMQSAALSVLDPKPAVELTRLDRSSPSGELEGMWRTMSWDGAKAEAGERLPHIDGLPVVQVQVQSGEQGSRPVMVVAQQLASGQVIRTIEGPATDVSQLLSRRAITDVDSLFLLGDSARLGPEAIHAMAMQLGDRMLAITGDLPSDSLRAMIRRLNAEMRSK